LSLVDYVFRRLALDYLPVETREALGVKSIDERKATAADDAKAYGASAAPATAHADAAPAADAEADEIVFLDAPPGEPATKHGTASQKAVDAPLCYSCGGKMQPAGSCYVCGTCGSTSGCS
jgi:ribonucleoside-diphosphate reductase alpha chain